MGDLLLSQKIVHTHYSDLERNHRVVGSGTLLRWVVLCSESIRESLSSVLTNVDARHPPGGRSSTPHTDFELSRGSVVEHSFTMQKDPAAACFVDDLIETLTLYPRHAALLPKRELCC